MIDYSQPPKFEKRNHHFVPQFWQRHFRGADRRLFKTSHGKIVIASTKSTMSEDYTYLAFDNGWRPTDVIEDELSRWETIASGLISGILPSNKSLSDDEWASLCIWMGISTSRHPHVMGRYKPIVSSYALELATVHDFSGYPDFQTHLVAKFGSAVSEDEYELLKSQSAEALLAEAEYIEAMSKHHPALPQTESILANYPVSICVYGLDLTLIDANTPEEFILGSNPLPNKDLGSGFTVPLSRHVALVANVAENPSNPARARRAATAWEVDKVNEEQVLRSEQAIASSKAILEKWKDKLIPVSADV